MFTSVAHTVHMTQALFCSPFASPTPFLLITHRQLAYEQKLVKLEMSMAKNAAEGAGMPADALDALEAAVNHNLDLLHQTLNDKIMELQEARKVGRVGEGLVQGGGCRGLERDVRC